MKNIKIFLGGAFVLFPALIFSRNGNPDSWCRNGFFPGEARSDTIGIIKPVKANKVYFYADDDGCPSAEKKCRKKAYLISGDRVLIAGEFGNYICSWYTSKNGRETAGWLSKSDVEFRKITAPLKSDWPGIWTFYENEIVISQISDGRFHITGTATWGSGMSVHVGEFDITEFSKGNSLENKINDEYECFIRIHLVEDKLIVSDNKNCGGANVTFDGVYIRRPELQSSRFLPKIPGFSENLNGFVPKGWNILKKIEGDLNRDQKNDAVLVLSPDNEEKLDMDDGHKRILVILFSEKVGYTISQYTNRAILCYHCGGILGDPFQDISIKKGVLSIDHYGGSRDRWGYTHKFRYQDNEWYLIGETILKEDSVLGIYSEKDINLLTGDVIEKYTDKEKNISKIQKTRMVKKPLKTLSGFNIEN